MEIEAKDQREQFYALQRKYKPIIDILTDKQKIYIEKYRFKGIITGASPFIYRPQILFLGYNSSGGENWEKLRENIPLEPRLNEDKLMFFKWNSARKKSEWYALNQHVNNAFPHKIIDLLYELATLVYPERNNEKGTNQEPFWAKNMANSLMSMMYINLYPIATPDGNSLIKLLSRLKKEEGIPPECYKKKEWNLRKYMVEIMRQMVNVIEPKVIVCMGSQTFHDYTYTERKHHSINDILTHEKYPNVIGFSRKGAWETNIPNIAKAIYNRII